MRTSDPDEKYNCVGWAFEQKDWWWPEIGNRWPIPHCDGYLIDEFENLFAVWNWNRCDNSDFEPGWCKIALYVDDEGTPRHLARMVTDDRYGHGTAGLWTSKLGAGIDILHELPALSGADRYGVVHSIYRKQHTA